jgi:hypothetical protein
MQKKIARQIEFCYTENNHYEGEENVNNHTFQQVDGKEENLLAGHWVGRTGIVHPELPGAFINRSTLWGDGILNRRIWRQ